MRFPCGVVLMAALSLAGCGYHVAGHSNVLPLQIHSIAVTAFKNSSMQNKAPEMITAAVTRELIQRTKYQITADPATADAILSGSLVNVFSYPTTYDPVTGRASGVQFVVQVQIQLRERVSGKVLYNRPNFEVRERYEISVDPKTYFDESSGALTRLSRDVARTVVSGILEAF